MKFNLTFLFYPLKTERAAHWKLHLGRTLKRKKDILASLFFSFFLCPVIVCFELHLKQVFWSLGSAQWGWLLKETTSLFSHSWRFRTLTRRFSLQALRVHHSQVVSAGAIQSLHTVWLSTQGTWEKYKDPLLWKLQLEWSADPLMGRTGECFTLENRQMARKRW